MGDFIDEINELFRVGPRSVYYVILIAKFMPKILFVLPVTLYLTYLI